MELPFSQASENNKGPILEFLTDVLQASTSVLEIGGGTGQHAVFFAEQLPHLLWQSSDIPDYVATLSLRIQHAALPNVPAPLALDVNDKPWRCDRYDAVFTANSLHIMPAESVAAFFAELPDHLNESARLIVYGPFKYNGEFTTESNARFDLWLKEQNPLSGVRDFEWINELAESAGLTLVADNAMPANNQLLVWRQ